MVNLTHTKVGFDEDPLIFLTNHWLRVDIVLDGLAKHNLHPQLEPPACLLITLLLLLFQIRTRQTNRQIAWTKRTFVMLVTVTTKKILSTFVRVKNA